VNRGDWGGQSILQVLKLPGEKGMQGEESIAPCYQERGPKKKRSAINNKLVDRGGERTGLRDYGPKTASIELVKTKKTMEIDAFGEE